MNPHEYIDKITNLLEKLLKSMEGEIAISESDKAKLKEANEIQGYLDEYKGDIKALNSIYCMNLSIITPEEKQLLHEALQAIKLREANNKFLVAATDDQIRESTSKIIEKVQKYVNEILRKYSKPKTTEDIEKIKEAMTYFECLNPGELIDIEEEYIQCLVDPKKTLLKGRNKDSLFIIIHELIEDYCYYTYTQLITPIKERKTRVVVPNIEYDDLKALFEEYGYKIEDYDEELIKKILNNGTLENVRAVFEFLKDSKYFSTPIKITKANQYELLTLLYRGDKETIDDMIKFSKDLKIPIASLFKKSFSSFYAKSRKGAEPSDGGMDILDYSEASTHDDTKANGYYLKELGYDVAECYQKNSPAFALNHDRVVKNAEDIVRVFNSVEGKNYSNIHAIYPTSITWMRGQDVIKSILLYSELGELEYIKKNPSRLSVGLEKIIPYRLKAAQIMNYDYRLAGNRFDGIITTHPSATDAMSEKRAEHKDGTIGRTILEIDENSYNVPEVGELKHHIFTPATEAKFIGEIEAYLVGDTSFVEEMDFVKNLEQDEGYYYINGVKINKLKFNNAFAALQHYIPDVEFEKIVLFCMNYNSLLTDEEFKALTEGISSAVGRRL